MTSVLGAISPAASAGDFTDPTTCIESQLSNKKPVAVCMNESQKECFGFEEGSPAGTLCFREAKEFWGKLISEKMETLRTGASEEIAVIAGIEVKYDLKANLMQCDRMEELSLVRRDPDEFTLHARARCEATAVGLAFVKLHVQSMNVK